MFKDCGTFPFRTRSHGRTGPVKGPSSSMQDAQVFCEDPCSQPAEINVRLSAAQTCIHLHMHPKVHRLRVWRTVKVHTAAGI